MHGRLPGIQMAHSCLLHQVIRLASCGM